MPLGFSVTLPEQEIILTNKIRFIITGVLYGEE